MTSTNIDVDVPDSTQSLLFLQSIWAGEQDTDYFTILINGRRQIEACHRTVQLVQIQSFEDV